MYNKFTDSLKIFEIEEDSYHNIIVTICHKVAPLLFGKYYMKQTNHFIDKDSKPEIKIKVKAINIRSLLHYMKQRVDNSLDIKSWYKTDITKSLDEVTTNVRKQKLYNEANKEILKIIR